MKKQVRTNLLIGLIYCLAATTACQSQQQPFDTVNTNIEEESTSAAPVEIDIYDRLRELDFGGYNFNIITYDNLYWNAYAAPEESNGDILNDAAYDRNREVEEILNISISLQRDNNYEAKFKNLVLSGDPDSVDMIIFWSTGERSQYISNGLVYNWNKLPYVKLNADWYNQTANEAYSIAGTQYFAVSDFTFPIQQHFRILFNKELAENFKISSPYDAVFDGVWTYDHMLGDIKNVYSDLNGNTTDDLDDRYGMVLNSAFASAFPLNTGELQVTSEKDGFEFNLFSEKIANMVEKIVALHSNPDVYVDMSGKNMQYDIFYSGRSLYMTYGSDPALLRDVEFDFGYLPYPKYDESQEDYVVWSAGGMMALPASLDNPDRTGAIIEALSAGSNKYVKDAFINKYIEGKVLRDTESQEIYRMMRSAATYDLSYNIDPTNLLANYAYYSYYMNNKSADVASRWAQIREQVQLKYDELYKAAIDG